jgi:antitoxin CcdA
MRIEYAHPMRARSKSRKTPTNLSVRADLVRRARELKLNLSDLLQQALERAIREAERRAWLADNDDAIDQYNEQVARRGVFSDGLRRF